MRSSPPTVDCLGLGIMPLDILMSVPRFPEPNGKVNATDLTVQGGGPVPNSLVGLSRLGRSTSLIAVLGDDFLGTECIRQLASERVQTDHIIRKRGTSDAAIGYIEERTGRRTLVFNPGQHIKASELRPSRYPVPRLVHLDGRHVEACIRLAKWGRRMKATILFDIGSIRNDVSALLPLVDHLVVADAFALPFTETRAARAAVRKLTEHCPGSIVVTCGLEGQWALEEGRLYHQEAYPVTAVDQTGAGDAFHVGYMDALLDGADMPTRLRRGSLVAGLNCTANGARGGLPTRRRLARFAQERINARA